MTRNGAGPSRTYLNSRSGDRVVMEMEDWQKSLLAVISHNPRILLAKYTDLDQTTIRAATYMSDLFKYRSWNGGDATGLGNYDPASLLSVKYPGFQVPLRVGPSEASPDEPPCPSDTPKQRLRMNQQCKVCGEPAAGFHFGAFTCEGCKSFFGRTYNNLGSITECKNNGECVINKKNRTACKACRLRKCLLVGMSKSGSRYGRRSNWFKIHCLLQEQSQNGTNGLNANIFGTPPAFFPGSFLSNPLLSPDKFFQSAAAMHGLQRTKKEEASNHSESGESSIGEADDESRSASALSFLRPPSSHKTPSPFSEKDFSQRTSALGKHASPFASNVTLNLPSSPIGSPVATGGIFFPPSQSSPNRLLYPAAVTKPGITPVNPHLLASWPPPGVQNGGNLVLCSPALAGVAVEQEHPIDLSVKASSDPYRSSPRSFSEKDVKETSDSEDENLTIDVELCKESVTLKNNPLDLTSKKVEVPQSG